MRKRDGSLSDTVHVLPDVFAAALAADGQGHAIAVGAGTSGADLRIAVFTGGAWEPATDHALSPPLQGAPSVTADDAGDAVIAWRDVDTSRYTYGAGAVRAMTGSLADGTFGAPAAVDDVLSPSGNATVAMASDGSTVIAYGDAPHQAVRVVRRDGIGPFGTPQVAACVDNFYTPDGFALDNSGRATLLAGGETHDAPATAASDKTCHVPETGSTGPRPSFSPNPVIAGEPVHIDDSGIRRPDWDIGRCGFDMDADGVQETTRDGPMLDWTFATPGRHPFLLQCQETSRGGDGTVAPYDTFVVDVFARPTLAVPTRVAHHEAVHRGVPLEANAFTGSEPAFVTFTVRAHGDVLGRVRRRLGTTPRTLRVPLNAAGRRAARHGVRARVVMRQAGTIEALQHVRIR
jgi:hypothetical protein